VNRCSVFLKNPKTMRVAFDKILHTYVKPYKMGDPFLETRFSFDGKRYALLLNQERIDRSFGDQEKVRGKHKEIEPIPAMSDVYKDARLLGRCIVRMQAHWTIAATI
jgi:hypothetical protein